MMAPGTLLNTELAKCLRSQSRIPYILLYLRITYLLLMYFLLWSNLCQCGYGWGSWIIFISLLWQFCEM